MITFVFAESALEEVPEKIRRKVKGSILDSNIMHKEMFKLKDFKRRGRPDLIHFSLLLLLDSLPNKKSELQVFIHTRNNKVISVNTETRLPRAYNRFYGLMEKLFESGEIRTDDGKVLLKLEKMTLRELIERINADKTILMHESGKRLGIEKLSEKFSGGNNLVVIGGFPHGTFSDSTFSLIKGAEIVSVFPKQLPVWSVASFVVDAYELYLEKREH